jgi:hypothetical protein
MQLNIFSIFCIIYYLRAYKKDVQINNYGKIEYQELYNETTKYALFSHIYFV